MAAGRPVDRSIYTPVAPHYMADPVSSAGMADPMIRRHGVRRGLDDMVEVPAGREVPALEPAPVALDGHELTDGTSPD